MEVIIGCDSPLKFLLQLRKCNQKLLAFPPGLGDNAAAYFILCCGVFIFPSAGNMYHTAEKRLDGLNIDSYNDVYPYPALK